MKDVYNKMRYGLAFTDLLGFFELSDGLAFTDLLGFLIVNILSDSKECVLLYCLIFLVVTFQLYS